MSDRVQKILYWVLTLPFCAMMMMSSYMYFSQNPEVAAGAKVLGLSMFFFQILGMAKLLGAIAILVGYIKTLKEWAYAGFTFVLLGATSFHLHMGDTFGHTIMPLVCLAVLMGSYCLWKKQIGEC
jgi:hypothetical protein